MPEGISQFDTFTHCACHLLNTFTPASIQTCILKTSFFIFQPPTLEMKGGREVGKTAEMQFTGVARS